MFFIFLINIYFKFLVNKILFTIQSINLILYIILDYKNLKFKYTTHTTILINFLVVPLFLWFMSSLLSLLIFLNRRTKQMQWIYHLSIFIKNNISYLNLFGEQNKWNGFIIYLFFLINNISYLNLFGWVKHVLNSYIKGGFLFFIF